MSETIRYVYEAEYNCQNGGHINPNWAERRQDSRWKCPEVMKHRFVAAIGENILEICKETFVKEGERFCDQCGVVLRDMEPQLVGLALVRVKINAGTEV